MTRDQQIAAAVIEAAAKAWHTQGLDLRGASWNEFARALDLDAILASVPKQEDADLDALQAELEWCIENGNVGPRSHKCLQSLLPLIDRLRKAEAAREGWKLVPIDAPTEVIVAIENEIDNQLTASAMSPGDMFRQDGQYIWDAAIAAAPDSADSAKEK